MYKLESGYCENSELTGRRKFLKTSALACTGMLGSACLDPFISATEIPIEESLYVIGPIKGYSPHIGALVSMLNYNRHTIINLVKSLSISELDHLQDTKANSIGALILHLGATEKLYQLMTFEGRGGFNKKEDKLWRAALELGENGRKYIRGQDVSYYLDRIFAVRQVTFRELKNKDDQWLFKADFKSLNSPTINTYWKWFHVCEHESHHRGQIAWLKSRIR